MPYPTPARYLDAQTQRYGSLDEKNRHLVTAFTRRLHDLQADPAFDPLLPAVLGAHITVRGSEMPTLFRLSEEEDVVFSDDDVPVGFAYVALGHIHKPQTPGGLEHVRYSGSIDRLDLGEGPDHKGIVLVDVGAEKTGATIRLSCPWTPRRSIASRSGLRSPICPDCGRSIRTMLGPWCASKAHGRPESTIARRCCVNFKKIFPRLV